MLYKLEQHGKPTEYYWQRTKETPFALLGDSTDLVKLYDLLGNFNAAIPDLPEQPAEAAPCYTVPEAVSAAITFEIINGLNTSRRRLTDSIRSAARAGRIAGAYRTPEGYWRLPVAAFNAWTAEHAEQRRGRPRKEAGNNWLITVQRRIQAEVNAEALDTYTVEIWRNRATGEQYAIKRDSTGIAVGAVGPFAETGFDIGIDPVEWSLDLAHTLQIHSLLGGYERWEAGE